MNKGLLVLNIVLFIAVVILFFLFFSRKDKTISVIPTRSNHDTTALRQQTPVAYFDMDSIEENFFLWKKVQDEVLKSEQTINDSINRMKMGLQMQYQQFKEQEAKMPLDDIKKANSYFMERDQEIKNRERTLMQDYQKYYMNRQQEIVNKIKNYCKEFNKDKKYSYIIAREPGLFYYTDTAYNVTSELLKGLNAFYNKKK